MDNRKGRRFRQLSRTCRGIIAALVATVWITIPLVAQAHPLGNFTINRYSRLDVATQQIDLTYIVDMAEIPAHQARTVMDTNGDGTISTAEESTYVTEQLAQLQHNLHLTIDGVQTPWRVLEQQLTFPEGQAGLPTLRLQMRFRAALPDHTGPRRVEFRDDNYPERVGWQEVVVRAATGAALLESTAPAEDVSQELRRYPDDLLLRPLAVNGASFQFAPAATVDSALASAAGAPENGDTVADGTAIGDTPMDRSTLLASVKLPFNTNTNAKDPFADLIAIPLSGPLTIVLALVAAFGWGAAHALSPGHGKTIVGAYLVGSRGTARHALFLGITTTVTHTAGVFALGFVTLLASQFILPEKLFPWLSLLSGLLVVIIGLTMARRWLGDLWRREAHGHAHPHTHHHHEHHHHEHDHHEHEYHEHEYHEHDHHEHDHHEHDHHEHGHAHHHGHHHAHIHHGHAEHDHTHAAQDHAHAGAGGVYHRDSLGRWHSHTVPDLDRNAVTWRNLLALGISGGLLPCPSALVVMLGAIALQRVGFGLLLIVAFSLGLSSVLTGIGIALVSTGKLLERLPESGRLVRVLPVASALFITLLGAGITLQAWWQLWPM